ncbi:hypothetical protein ABH920_001295 [Catenulispora sp. EB89]
MVPRWLRWRLAVVRVHDRARVRVTAHTSGGRLAAAFGGCLKVKDRASGGACAASGTRSGEGGGRAVCCRTLLVVACVPGSPSHRRLTEADRSGGIKSDPCCCGVVSCDLTPPARSAWLRPPTRRGTRDNPACGKDSLVLGTPRHHPHVHAPEWTPSTPQWGCPGSLVAVGGACTTSPDWRGQAGRGWTTAACDAALPRQAGMVPFRATSATRDPGLRDQHSDRRRGGGLGIPQSLECPRRRRLLLTSGAHHTRPPAAHPTCAQ